MYTEKIVGFFIYNELHTVVQNELSSDSPGELKEAAKSVTKVPASLANDFALVKCTLDEKTVPERSLRIFGLIQQLERIRYCVAHYS